MVCQMDRMSSPCDLSELSVVAVGHMPGISEGLDCPVSLPETMNKSTFLKEALGMRLLVLSSHLSDAEVIKVTLLFF